MAARPTVHTHDRKFSIKSYYNVARKYDYNNQNNFFLRESNFFVLTVSASIPCSLLDERLLTSFFLPLLSLFGCFSWFLRLQNFPSNGRLQPRAGVLMAQHMQNSESQLPACTPSIPPFLLRIALRNHSVLLLTVSIRKTS